MTTTGGDKARQNEGKERRRKIASSEYGRGIRVGKGGEKRDYLTVPSREAVEVLIRNAGDHLHGTRSSTPSPPKPPLLPLFALLLSPPPPPPVRLSTRLSFILCFFVSLFLSFHLSLSLLFPFCFTLFFYLYRFSHHHDLLYIYFFAFIFINLSLFKVFLSRTRRFYN